MKRKPIILCLLLLVLLSALAVVGGHYYIRKPPINREAYAKIKEAMTREEVEAILGKPDRPADQTSVWNIWRGTGYDAGTTTFVRYENDIVVAVKCIPDDEPTLLEMVIKKWLGLK